MQHKDIPSLSRLFNQMDQEIQSKLQDLLGTFSTSIFHYISYLFNRLWQSGALIINLFSLLFVTPLISFYLLRDWPIIINNSQKLVPEHYKSKIFPILFKVDETLSDYLHGQINVCMIMAFYYSAIFSIVKLEFSILIGVMAGILTFITYIGPIFSLLCALLLAVLQGISLSSLTVMVILFVIGQIIEGNLVTPRFVGKKIGLHPVTMLFAMFTGGSIAGLVGVIISIPIAAIVAIIAKSLLNQYYLSNFYKGNNAPTTI